LEISNMQETPARSRRHWADVAVIIVGLGLFGLAIWFPPFTTTTGADEVKTAPMVWPIYAIAGGLTLLGLFAGQRWRLRTLARVLLIAAVVVLAVGLFTGFRELGPAAWLTVIIPGIVLLVAAPFFGPMPRAADSPR
jgi:O-antigen/teichoic acid export membrane protein